jgi:hypothetical protein
VPYAQVLTTAYVAGATGGTFADSLAANSGDSLSVANYDTGGARIIEGWAIDSDHACEIQVYYSRPESTHDQQHGWRFGVPGAALSGAATLAAFNVMPGYTSFPVFKSDTPTIQVTSTASDDVIFSYLTEYDDLPGASAMYTDYSTVMSLYKSALGIYLNPTGGSVGTYGTARAINADDDRLHANTYYAIMGVSVRIPVTTIAIQMPTTANQKIGMSGGLIASSPVSWFADMSFKYGRKLIPWFNSNDKGNVNVYVVDGEGATSPILDFQLIELTGMPG